MMISTLNTVFIKLINVASSRRRAHLSIKRNAWRTRELCRAIALLFFATYMLSPLADPLQISAVASDRRDYQPGESPIVVRFKLNKSADVSLTLYDARDIEVFRVTKKKLSAGEHSLSWPGVDNRGRPVPPEAYFYTLNARRNDENIVYDKTDITGGESVFVQEIRYDADSETLHYVIPEPARVFLRAGLKNAFIIKTLINGTVRNKGLHSEHWNGRDDNDLISVKGRDNYGIFGQGYALSDNAIVVTPADITDKGAKAQKGIHEDRQTLLPRNAAWIDDVDPLKKRLRSQRPKGLDRRAYQPIEQLKDVKVALSWPTNTPINGKGQAVIAAPIPLSVDLPADDALAIESQRLEVMIFLNNTLIYENEASYLPYTWVWDPKNLPAGEHYLTAFLAGFGGQFGVSINKIEIAKKPSNHKESTDVDRAGEH